MERPEIRVLLVDDDEEDYLIAADILAEIPGRAYRVTWKDSFNAALAAMDSESFDVLVFDYRLGPETGLDLLRAANQRGYAAPVILLTGQHDNEIDSEAIRLGALDYLIKGKITPDSFERSIRHAIEHHGVLTQVRASNAFLQSIIDALSSEVAIMNAREEILAVNRAWRKSFGGAHPWQLDGGERRNRPANVPGNADPDALIEGVRRVMAGDLDTFQLEYPCVTTGRRRWVIARVSRFDSEGAVHVVVAYEDITKRKLAEIDLEKNRALLEELSIRDELTRLYNRRHIGGFIKEALANAKRAGQPFALLMLDIDHFKAVNDTHGHAAGDAALVHVARICMDNCRASDCVARFGGEEIVFALPETPRDAVTKFAERVRNAIADTPLEVDTEGGGRAWLSLTASLGGAVYPESGGSAEELFAVADKGLYQAKADGRNCVRFHTEE